MRILIYILLFLPVIAFGQTQYIGSVTGKVVTRGTHEVDSIFRLPIRDTTGGAKGRVTVGLDSNMYYYNGSAWTKINNQSGGGGSTDSAVFATKAFVGNNYTPLSRTLTINGITYDLSANRTWTIPVLDTSLILVWSDTLAYLATKSDVAAKLNISDTSAMLTPYLRKIDTASLSARIDLRVKYSDTASMLDPYLLAIDTTGKWLYNIANGFGLSKSGGTQYPTLAIDTSVIATPHDLTSYVPYTGAISNVNIGNYHITATALIADTLEPRTSAGLHLHNASHQDIFIAGAGGGQNLTIYAPTNFDLLKNLSEEDTVLTTSSSGTIKKKGLTPYLKKADSTLYNPKYRHDTLTTNVYTALGGKQDALGYVPVDIADSGLVYTTPYALSFKVDSITKSTDTVYYWTSGVRHFGHLDATGGSPAWGTITGTLSAQTDLQSALDAKKNTNDSTATGGYVTHYQDDTAKVNLRTSIALKANDNEVVHLAGTETITGLKQFTGDITVTHSSGSGTAVAITKGGAGEGLTVDKTSGSGNAVTITGGTTDVHTLKLATTNTAAGSDSILVINGRQVYRVNQDYYMAKEDSALYATQYDITSRDWQDALDVNRMGDSVIVSDNLYVRLLNAYTPTSLNLWGDSRSVPYAVSPAFSSTYGYAQRLAALMNWTLRNRALSGTVLMKRTPIDPFGSSPNMIDNLPTVRNVTGLTDSAYKAIIAYGFNDIQYNGANYTAANFSADYTTVLDTFVARGWTMSNVLLIAPAYISPTAYVNYGSGAATQARHLEFVDTVRVLANRYGCKFLDAYRFEQNRGARQLFQTDSIHENVSGHGVMLEGVVNAFSEQTVRNNQALAVNGEAEFNDVRVRPIDSTTGQSFSSAAVVNSNGKLVSANNVFIENNPIVAQGASFSINGNGTMQTAVVNGIARLGNAHITAAFANPTAYPATAMGLYNNGLVFQSYVTSGSGADLVFNPFYGGGAFGNLTRQATGSKWDFTGGVYCHNGAVITGTHSITGKEGISLAYVSNVNYIYNANTTTNPLSLNFTGGNVLVASATDNGSGRKLQVTGRGGFTDTVFSAVALRAPKLFLSNPTKSGTTVDSVLVLNRTTNEVEYRPVPAGGSLTDGDKGDITVSSSGATWTIDNAVVDLTTKVTGILPGANGGTGVANTGKTITVSGNTTIGSSTHTVAFATGGNTSVTLPTTGTLATLTGSETLSNKTLTTPIISSISNTGTLTLPTVTATITAYKESNDASSATPTPIGDGRQNKYYLTALATAPTFAAPSGTPANGNELLIRIKDNGTARALGWNAIYRGGTSIALPTTTVINKTMYVQFVYNSADSKWDLVGLTDGL